MACDGYYRIVVPVDFSECSRAAWTEAQRLARAFGSEIVLVHVLDLLGERRRRRHDVVGPARRAALTEVNPLIAGARCATAVDVRARRLPR